MCVMSSSQNNSKVSSSPLLVPSPQEANQSSASTGKWHSSVTQPLRWSSTDTHLPSGTFRIPHRLMAQAIHLYKPTNKSEVRLVYRFVGSNTSLRHQKSFSFSKYGETIAWHLAKQTFHYINETGEFPPNFSESSLNTSVSLKENHANPMPSTTNIFLPSDLSQIQDPPRQQAVNKLIPTTISSTTSDINSQYTLTSEHLNPFHNPQRFSLTDTCKNETISNLNHKTIPPHQLSSHTIPSNTFHLDQSFTQQKSQQKSQQRSQQKSKSLSDRSTSVIHVPSRVRQLNESLSNPVPSSSRSSLIVSRDNSISGVQLVNPVPSQSCVLDQLVYNPSHKNLVKTTTNETTNESVSVGFLKYSAEHIPRRDIQVLASSLSNNYSEVPIHYLGPRTRRSKRAIEEMIFGSNKHSLTPSDTQSSETVLQILSPNETITSLANSYVSSNHQHLVSSQQSIPLRHSSSSSTLSSPSSFIEVDFDPLGTNDEQHRDFASVEWSNEFPPTMNCQLECCPLLPSPTLSIRNDSSQISVSITRMEFDINKSQTRMEADKDMMNIDTKSVEEDPKNDDVVTEKLQPAAAQIQEAKDRVRRLTLVSEFNARDHNHVGTKIKRQQNEVSVETPKNGIANRRVGRPPRKKSQESDGRIHTVEQANQAEQKGGNNKKRKRSRTVGEKDVQVTESGFGNNKKMDVPGIVVKNRIKKATKKKEQQQQQRPIPLSLELVGSSSTSLNIDIPTDDENPYRRLYSRPSKKRCPNNDITLTPLSTTDTIRSVLTPAFMNEDQLNKYSSAFDNYCQTYLGIENGDKETLNQDEMIDGQSIAREVEEDKSVSWRFKNWLRMSIPYGAPKKKDCKSHKLVEPPITRSRWRSRQLKATRDETSSVLSDDGLSDNGSENGENRRMKKMTNQLNRNKKEKKSSMVLNSDIQEGSGLYISKRQNNNNNNDDDDLLYVCGVLSKVSKELSKSNQPINVVYGGDWDMDNLWDIYQTGDSEKWDESSESESDQCDQEKVMLRSLSKRISEESGICKDFGESDLIDRLYTKLSQDENVTSQPKWNMIRQSCIKAQRIYHASQLGQLTFSQLPLEEDHEIRDNIVFPSDPLYSLFEYLDSHLFSKAWLEATTIPDEIEILKIEEFNEKYQKSFIKYKTRSTTNIEASQSVDPKGTRSDRYVLGQEFRDLVCQSSPLAADSPSSIDIREHADENYIKHSEGFFNSEEVNCASSVVEFPYMKQWRTDLKSQFESIYLDEFISSENLKELNRLTSKNQLLIKETQQQQQQQHDNDMKATSIEEAELLQKVTDKSKSQNILINSNFQMKECKKQQKQQNAKKSKQTSALTEQEPQGNSDRTASNVSTLSQSFIQHSSLLPQSWQHQPQRTPNSAASPYLRLTPIVHPDDTSSQHLSNSQPTNLNTSESSSVVNHRSDTLQKHLSEGRNHSQSQPFPELLPNYALATALSGRQRPLISAMPLPLPQPRLIIPNNLRTTPSSIQSSSTTAMPWTQQQIIQQQHPYRYHVPKCSTHAPIQCHQPIQLTPCGFPATLRGSGIPQQTQRNVRGEDIRIDQTESTNNTTTNLLTTADKQTTNGIGLLPQAIIEINQGWISKAKSQVNSMVMSSRDSVTTHRSPNTLTEARWMPPQDVYRPLPWPLQSPTSSVMADHLSYSQTSSRKVASRRQENIANNEVGVEQTSLIIPDLKGSEKRDGNRQSGPDSLKEERGNENMNKGNSSIALIIENEKNRDSIVELIDLDIEEANNEFRRAERRDRVASTANVMVVSCKQEQPEAKVQKRKSVNGLVPIERDKKKQRMKDNDEREDKKETVGHRQQLRVSGSSSRLYLSADSFRNSYHFDLGSKQHQKQEPKEWLVSSSSSPNLKEPLQATTSTYRECTLGQNHPLHQSGNPPYSVDLSCPSLSMSITVPNARAKASTAAHRLSVTSSPTLSKRVRQNCKKAVQIDPRVLQMEDSSIIYHDSPIRHNQHSSNQEQTASFESAVQAVQLCRFHEVEPGRVAAKQVSSQHNIESRSTESPILKEEFRSEFRSKEKPNRKRNRICRDGTEIKLESNTKRNDKENQSAIQMMECCSSSSSTNVELRDIDSSNKEELISKKSKELTRTVSNVQSMVKKANPKCRLTAIEKEDQIINRCSSTESLSPYAIPNPI